MDKDIFKLIVESTASGKIEKETAVEIIKALKRNEKDSGSNDIAIIGMAAKLPMAEDINEFWQNIRNGVDCIRDFPDGRKADIDSYVQLMGMKRNEVRYIKAAYLDEIDKFDYKFFGISPKEANMLDPHQRLLLETVFQSVEDAGYSVDKLSGSSTGVYVGFRTDMSLSYEKIAAHSPALKGENLFVGNLISILAGRISYIMDLKGPSMVIDTACSSSLVAVHSACQAIRNGECDQAVAGTIRIMLTPVDDTDKKVGIEASGSRTKSFDDSSDGTGWGEGVISVLLKRLDNAVRDNDNIYAVIKGSAVNQDGLSMAITAPNVNAQEDVITRAWKNSCVDPESITYIEAHGTGTPLGDPIEVDGINRAFLKYSNNKQFCGIGSVKANIGHLDNAAGLAAIVKMALAIQHKELPPSIHFQKPNRKIKFEDSPVYVNDILKSWKTDKLPRRCGISSFGMSGTNCHIILEEAPAVREERKRSNIGRYIMTISAKSEEALGEILKGYDRYMEEGLKEDIVDICYTSNTGRGHYNFRIAIAARDSGELAERIHKLYKEGIRCADNENIFYGRHNIIAANRPKREAWDIIEEEIVEISEIAHKRMDELRKEVDLQDSLKDICRLYVKGARIKWEKLYSDEAVKRARLPVYPFQKLRCWVEMPKAPFESDPSDENPLFYRMDWEPSDIIDTQNVWPNGTVMVFADECGKGAEVVDRLRSQGTEIIEVMLGDRFENRGSRYLIDGSPDSYIKLLEEVGDKRISQILHLFTMGESSETKDICELDASLKKGVYSLFYLIKAIYANQVKADMDIVLVSRLAYSVTGDETGINPENAMLSGLGKVAGMENFRLRCRSIDLDDHTNIGHILAELGTGGREYQVAYRNDRRYVQVMKIADPADSPEKKITLDTEGVYVITGGTGGIGLEVAKQLASKAKVNLALVNRSKMPERSEWDKTVENEKDSRLAQKIKAIKQIEESGSTVECFSADAANKGEVGRVLDNLRRKYGKINGIVHSAGIAGEGFIFRKNEEAFTKVLSPKVKGTWILDHLTRKDELQFFILFSSCISVMGAPGQADYSSANSYLDSFEAYRNKKGMKTITINWTGWKETGMASDYGFNKDGLFKTITTAKAMNAFEKVMNSDITRLVIGELDVQNEVLDKFNLPVVLSHELKAYIRSKRGNAAGKGDSSFNYEAKKVTLKGRDTDDYTVAEKQIAQIWANALGVNEINIFDSFFEIGGHSLMAIKVQTDMEKLNMQIDESDIYEHSTVKELAEYIEKRI